MPTLASLRAAIRRHTYFDEGKTLARLVSGARLGEEQRKRITRRAVELIEAVRSSSDPGMMEEFLAEYGLSSREGVALMCLAEALLRVPDAETMDDLIKDKIAPHDWSEHAGDSSSIFVNASTWALALTGKVLEDRGGGIERTLRSMVRRLGEPVIRTAVSRAMREMGEQFVLGRTIDEAVKRGKPYTRKGYLYSFDMLGEAARTESDALRYLAAYKDAISSLDSGATGTNIRHNAGISVKLSALHPRYEQAQRETMLPVLSARLLSLCKAARSARMGLNIDAEEADRLDLSLDVIHQVLAAPELAGWDGFGVVVQAYGLRAPYVLDWLHTLAQRLDRRIMVRLVKGAYWDTEMKRAQTLGLTGYPVFTRKTNTDVSYIACAKKLLGMTDRIYPQFATHNAHTVAAVLELATDKNAFEFQRLHGMGEALHETVRAQHGTRCRIYAPVGAHEDLLAYLVRRLLENGANSSFVHQIVDEEVSAETIARDPFAAVAEQSETANPLIPEPRAIFEPGRVNSSGYDLTEPVTLKGITHAREAFSGELHWSARASVGAAKTSRQIVNPARPGDVVGEVFEATAGSASKAIALALRAQGEWASTPVAERAAILRRAADLYEKHAIEFYALCTREAGKTLADGVAEVREAVDFLRYYAAQAKEADEMGTVARGVIVCISPWNFPLAIFTGQIAAALVTGNTVVAKPAEQTPLIAARAVEFLHYAGVPAGALHILPGDGPSVGAPLTADPRIAGVCFTGSTEVARLIERQLATTASPDAMLIAETGGLNAMIVDSTALPEQAVRDIIASAFQSAGQRCSALRMLYVQSDVEKRMLEMLVGATKELRVGDPWDIATDVGPVIDAEAHDQIGTYSDTMAKAGKEISRLAAPDDGLFVPPQIVRVNGIADLEREVFGPVLHVATFEPEEISLVVDAINARGYGLTFGLHTRIDGRVQKIIDRVKVGNVYINRNQIGAVVGSQPFGGEGLSGTGPKAGGPHYLRRFRKSAIATGPVGQGEAASMPRRFPDASSWAMRGDRVETLRKLLRGKAPAAIAAAAALDYGSVDLPGPTGEANSLSLSPRGRALCLGPDVETVLAQTVQALAAGCSVIAIAPGARAALQPLTGKGLPLEIVEGTLLPAELETVTADVVAYSRAGETAKEIRRTLASRNGLLVPLVAEMIYPAAYAHERTICVDTTAAGGNASLLAAS